jgi:mRNA interferase MazF
VTFDGHDVVVVPFPFSERAGTKRRPALVISSAAFNGRHNHLVLAMITTAAKASWASDVPITDLEAAGLPHQSVARLKLFTLDASLALRRLGRLAGNDARAVEASLAENLVAP